MREFGKPWAVGMLLILTFAVLGELFTVFNDYVFHRLGLNRNAVMTVLWVLPFFAAYFASRYSETHKVLTGLSFMLLFPLVGSVAHYINGELGGPVDFVGLSGAALIFKLYFAVGSILVIAGTLLGLLLSKRAS
jgi:hypothetical protein